MRPEAGGKTLVTLGEVVNAVRWDYVPSQELLSPLVETARYFQDFPWDGELDDATGPVGGPAAPEIPGP
ncbi:MAG TPA: hypothetical protein VL025_00475 [Thermoanaerobaculia bacterium]|nr:hypothetical protein [Thermoanaerobaculia bacterium]